MLVGTCYEKESEVHFANAQETKRSEILHMGFKCAPKTMRKLAKFTIWKCKSSCTSCMLQIQREVGAKQKGLFTNPLAFYKFSFVVCI